jgi:tRNA pseudouridine32 synthase/23S rRNA pseudouridine746 synthase
MIRRISKPNPPHFETLFAEKSPLPMRLPPRNGVCASTLQLPPGAWATVLDCLCAHFGAIGRPEWEDRFARGRVTDEFAVALTAATAYREGMRVQYYREVAAEARIPFTEAILYADADLVAADKPHFLPVMPAGVYVEETLLARLIRRLDNPDLVPLHRIDRGTAGVVLFSANPATRSRYQALFREQAIVKRYEAIAPALPQHAFPLVRSTRIERGEPFFRMREVAGVANAHTRIEVAQRGAALWRYALFPQSGRKHQLRVQMAGLGAAIVNDDNYPELTGRAADDYSQPLQLLAHGLAFADPIDGAPRAFHSRFGLDSPDATTADCS